MRGIMRILLEIHYWCAVSSIDLGKRKKKARNFAGRLDGEGLLSHAVLLRWQLPKITAL